MLLALDTSGALVTVALHDGRPGSGRGTIVAHRAVAASAQHAELLAPLIEAALADAGVGADALDAVAVGVGPGPFTGLRVGLVTAQVLGLARGIAVHGVCSLDALAQQAVDGGTVDGGFLVATDARRKEVYWARYRVVAGPDGERLAEREGGVGVDAPATVPRGELPVLGRGTALYPELLGAGPGGRGPLDVTAEAVARRVVRSGGGEATGTAVRPMYLRRPDAVAPGPRKRVMT